MNEVFGDCCKDKTLKSFEMQNSCCYRVPRRSWDECPCQCNCHCWCEDCTPVTTPGQVTLFDLGEAFTDNRVIITIRNCSSTKVTLKAIKEKRKPIEKTIKPFSCVTLTFSDIQELVIENDTCTPAVVEADYRIHYEYTVNCGCNFF